MKNPQPKGDQVSAEQVAQTRPFADVLLELAKGRIHNEASIALQDLVEAVAERGGKGAVTLVINVASSKAEGQVEVTADVKTKLPATKRPTSLFFVTADHNLSRDNPEQPRLPMRDVSAPPEQLREADSK